MSGMKRISSFGVSTACLVPFNIEEETDLDEDLLEFLRNSRASSMKNEVSVVEKSEEDSEDDSVASNCKIRFAPTVNVRQVYKYEDGEEELVDTVATLKKGDFSKPYIEPVEFDAEEEAVRSQLEGCVRAEKRIRHDYGKMYGCGNCFRTGSSSSLSCDAEDDFNSESDDDNVAEIHPVRVIEASAPSSMWISATV